MSLRLAFFSPVPPQPSGIADYLADLVPHLPEHWSLDVFTDVGVEADASFLGDRGVCLPYTAWQACHADDPYDLNVYQVGNHVLHAYTLPWVTGRPGLLVLHDLVVHPSRVQYAVETGGIAGYRQVAERARPDVGRALGHLVAGGLAGSEVHFRFPLCDDLVNASLVTAVHGEALASWLRAVVPGGEVHQVVHWRKVPEVDAGRVKGWRRRLQGPAEGRSGTAPVRGLPTGAGGGATAGGERAMAGGERATAGGERTMAGDERALAGERVTAGGKHATAAGDRARAGPPLVGCFGYIGAARRLDRVIDALGYLAPELDFRLVVAGSVDAALELPARAAARGLGDRVHWLGHVSDDDFAALMRTVDLAVNLRYPPARASSGVLHQLLQIGVPTVVTDLVHWADYPDDAVARVPPGPDEAEHGALVAVLRSWLSDPGNRRAVSRAAADWARRHLTPEAMAGSYARAVHAALARRG